MLAQAPETERLLEAATLELDVPGTARTFACDIALMPGELHLVLSAAPDRSTAIIDALLGLSGDGEVRFQGVAWSEMTPGEAMRARGRVGRMLTRGNWLENRSVMDNLLLPLRHNTVMPDELLQNIASDLARRFELPGVPLLQPHECLPSDLHRAACMKPFLGRPELVFLEHPMEHGETRLLPPLVAAVQQVQRRGGAVVWFTRRRDVLWDSGLAPDRAYRITGSRLLELVPGR